MRSPSLPGEEGGDVKPRPIARLGQYTRRDVDLDYRACYSPRSAVVGTSLRTVATGVKYRIQEPTSKGASQPSRLGLILEFCSREVSIVLR